uniref:Major vault protein n=1 Tax=Raphidocystis contractilis TaxID=2792838 RepID=A0A3G9DX28_RAPCO|nr:major vault protein [Raphidocystis contractilis]
MGDSVIRVPPYFFLHVLDNNKNITRLEVGPQTFVRQEHEKVVLGPERMVTIPPRHYCVIVNPVLRAKDGKVLVDSYGQVCLAHSDNEIRFAQDPFPLYPGEKLGSKVTPLQVLPPNKALRLRALRDFTDEAGKEIRAGDEWLFHGPGTYTPRVDVEEVDTVNAIIIKPNEALKLRARQTFVARSGETRRAGEVWLVNEEGAYLPDVFEETVSIVKAYVLTEKTGLHVRSTRTFKDVFGKERKAGSEWLVTIKDAETYIPGVYEEVVGEVAAVTLTTRQYCVVLDPIDTTGTPKYGQRELRKGEMTFFLYPGESLESGVQNVFVLGEEDGLLVRARQTFDDHKPGDRWMILGPCEYVPSVEVEIIDRRKSIPLDENEGVYVRDTRTGKVRPVTGQSYMLEPFEELWQKDLPRAVEDLLTSDLDPLADRTSGAPAARTGPRDKTKVVTYRVPHNAAVQIYDYKHKRSRIVFGPELVLLGPDEQFTQLSLSGGKPKKANQIRSLVLLLGPDFMTDIVTVETSDHARLSLTLSYNWHFEVDRDDAESVARIFSVPDFVGDACKAIASRVRGSVAQVPFDNFHRESARIIRMAVFGKDDDGKIKNNFTFPANNLVITNIDIQSVEPVDQKTRDSLQKSVQLAIEITTKSQEAAARHEAERREQEARGKLERQKIKDEAEAEKSRADLLLLQAASAAVESTGQAKAEAQARAEAAEIEGRAAVTQAQLKAQAMKIESDAELTQTKLRQDAEVDHRSKIDTLEISKADKLAEIESRKFKNIVDSIGASTIKDIAQAGPEMQAKLLGGLGVKSLLITDGNSPINLFNTANGLVGMPGQQ